MVDPNNYDRRGNDNSGIVLRCRKIVADRLVYFDHNESGGWVIRDFLSGYRLSDNDSTLTRAEIENDADHNEFPPWSNAERDRREWETYLRLRTTAVFRLHRAPNVDPPNPASGNWRPL